MFSPHLRSICSHLLLLVILAAPVFARPSTDSGLDGRYLSADSSPSFQSNPLRYPPESPFQPLLQRSSSTAGVRPQDATSALRPDSTALLQGDSYQYPAADDTGPSRREKTISDTLSMLTNVDSDSVSHKKNQGSCLIAVLLKAVRVPEDTLREAQNRDPALHSREKDMWQRLIGMMALDFIPGEEDDEEEDDDDEEDYDDDYYDDDYYDDYDYDCPDGDSECDDDTATATNEFTLISFPPMMT